MIKWGERYDYKGFHGCDSHCYIKVAGNAVLCTEAEDNEGTSVTNMAETLATLVCRDFDIPPESLTWIEHYTHEWVIGETEMRETFDLVNFDIEVKPIYPFGSVVGKHFVNPKWTPANMEYVRKTFNLCQW